MPVICRPFLLEITVFVSYSPQHSGWFCNVHPCLFSGKFGLHVLIIQLGPFYHVWHQVEMRVSDWSWTPLLIYIWIITVVECSVIVVSQLQKILFVGTNLCKNWKSFCKSCLTTDTLTCNKEIYVDPTWISLAYRVGKTVLFNCSLHAIISAIKLTCNR